MTDKIFAVMAYINNSDLILDDFYKFGDNAKYDCNFTKLEIDIDDVAQMNFNEKFYAELGYYILSRIRAYHITKDL